MNRRLKILLYWVFKNKFEISLIELIRFLKKPKSAHTAKQYIKKTSNQKGNTLVSFHQVEGDLFWPDNFPLSDLYQIIVEIFDENDWHHYEYKHTRVSANDIVVDLGAAEGLFSLSILNRCKKILIVEPLDTFYSSLQKTFHKWIPGKVQLFKYAVSDRNTKGRLNSNSICSEVSEDSNGDVSMTTLDDLFYPNEQITYIKIDIEGYELPALKGAEKIIKKNLPRIALACYHQKNDYREIIKFVKELVPEYHYHIKGLSQFQGKPVMLHFWIP